MTAKPRFSRLLPTRLQTHWHQQLWAEEEVFEHSSAFFSSILQAFRSAQHSIILATYIFDLDNLGNQFIDALIAAKQRGVDIRVLLDGVGSMEDGSRIIQQLSAYGIPIKIYHPLPWQKLNYQHALRLGSWIGNFIACLLKINQRHHAKFCIVDDEVLWSGSQNISNHHLPTSDGGEGWHDYGARVSGSAVAKVVQLFDDFWHYRKPRLGHGLFDHYWNNISALTRVHKNRLLVDKINNAQSLVWIINPYFSPTHGIIRALRVAQRRGVDVRIIVPSKSDIEIFPLLTSTYYDELIKASVRIFEYLPSILHAKLLLIDDFRLIGSTNFNHRSLLHDIEFDIVLESEAIRSQTKSMFLQDQTRCREITRDELKLLGWRRALGWLPWLVRYWL